MRLRHVTTQLVLPLMLPARFLLSLASSVLSEHVRPSSFSRSAPAAPGPSSPLHVLSRRSSNSTEHTVFACLIPVLVILSGIFAGLTLGYMSLDETQLNVLSISGTPYVSFPCLLSAWPCAF